VAIWHQQLERRERNLASQAQNAMLLAHYGEILFQLAVEKGADPEQLLEASGIRREVLESTEGYLSYVQFVLLVKNALEATGDPALGLKYGSRLKFTTHGSMAQAAISSGTLSEGIESLIKYYKIRFAQIDMKFFTEGDEAVVELEENIGLGPLQSFLVEALFVAIVEVNELLFGQKIIKTGRCRIAYPRPAYADQYSVFFVESIEFGAGCNQLRFNKAYLNEPMALANPVAKRLAEQQCEKELKTILVAPSIVARVKKCLTTKSDRLPSMEEVAEQLHMTSRTLRRQLQQFDTSFQDVLAEVRKQRALALLKATDKPIDEIAHELGYSDPSNFGRAFRKWTGKSPTDVRNESE
jgi:AraC-like DNA-binding protein